MKYQIDESELRNLVSQDLQNWKIAEHFGCSESTIEKRLRKLGLKKQRTGPKSGDRHPDWKGGVCIVKGYKYIYSPDHPNKTRGNYVSEHRLVMEQKLGRLLDRKEVVHHIDGDPLNNHPDNLAVFGCNAEHLKHELTGRVPNWTQPGLRKMKESKRLIALQRRTPYLSESYGVLGILSIDHQTSLFGSIPLSACEPISKHSGKWKFQFLPYMKSQIPHQ
jgi:predicted transcriptional regulator